MRKSEGAEQGRGGNELGIKRVGKRRVAAKEKGE